MRVPLRAPKPGLVGDMYAKPYRRDSDGYSEMRSAPRTYAWCGIRLELPFLKGVHLN